jgi:hypothetical protein
MARIFAFNAGAGAGHAVMILAKSLIGLPSGLACLHLYAI